MPGPGDGEGAASRSWRHLGLAACGLALLLVVLDSVWVSEDALITYRSIDNWVHGHGLRFNIDERVQSYTHPLWMLLNAGAYAVTGNVFWTTTVLGLLCSMSAWLALGWRHRDRPMLVLGGLTLPWMGAACVRRFSTSGFENPLSFLLLASFFVVLMRWDPKEPPPWGRLSLLTALLATNRLDTILLVAPVLAWMVVVERRRLRPVPIVAGALPLVGWLSFSLLYYGFPVPNTAPAKLSAGFPATLYIEHGALYLLDFLQRDLVGACVLLAGLGVGLRAAWRIARGRGDTSAARLVAMACGVLLYVLYVVRIGGDFLSGRFLAVCVVVALAITVERLPLAGVWLRQAGLRRGVLAAVVVFVGVLALDRVGAATTELTADSRIRATPLARAVLHHDGSWRLSRGARDFRKRGLAARKKAANGQRVTAQRALGFTGMAAGRQAILVDRFALADPLLARLPPKSGRAFSIGHVMRDVPAGYLHARETGSTEMMAPALAAYYERLWLVVSGPLLDPERLETIIAFNLGKVQPPAQ